MTNKYTVKELVEAISGLHHIEATIACDILSGDVDQNTLGAIDVTVFPMSKQSDLYRAIANWNLDFPAHKDDAILALLDELLEDALCQQQPGKEIGDRR